MIFQNLTFNERDIQKKQDDIQHTIHSYIFKCKILGFQTKLKQCVCRYGNDKIEKLYCTIRISILSYEEPNSGIYTKEQRSIIFSCSSDSLYSDLLRCPV